MFPYDRHEVVINKYLELHETSKFVIILVVVSSRRESECGEIDLISISSYATIATNVDNIQLFDKM